MFIVREMDKTRTAALGLDTLYKKARFPEGRSILSLQQLPECSDSAGKSCVSFLIQGGMFHLVIITI